MPFFDPSFRMESRFNPSSYHPSVVGASRARNMHMDREGFYPEISRRAIEYTSVNFESVPSTTASEPDDPWHESMQSNGALINYAAFSLDHSEYKPRTNIHGGTFIGGNVNHIQHNGKMGLYILHRAIAGDALHDSAARYPQPKCHPETRTKLLNDLWDWACGSEPQRNYISSDSGSQNCDWTAERPPSSKILWLHGPAGSGKSAIAQSFCQRLQAEGSLGGSFFFSRNDLLSGNGNRLFLTIAYQLALLLPELKRTILRSVENDPSIIHKSISTQLHKMIIEPCLEQPTVTGNLVIVIDGLDECEGQDIQREILRLAGYAVHQKRLQLRFFVASRPEPHIKEMFNDTRLAGVHCPINICQSFDDVRKYLQDEFSRIHKEHDTMARISMPWPSAEVIENVVDKSSGYFIYASTVVKFIDDRNFRPSERLKVVMGNSEPDFGSPFCALDQLYNQILCDVPTRPQLLKILGVIVTLGVFSVPHIEQLLELEPGDVRLALHGLHSVLSVPPEDKDNDIFSNGVIVHHASFEDFLNDQTRSGTFYVGGEQSHTNLARCILKAFTYTFTHPSPDCYIHGSW
ncbi:hypothetical protein B0H11DRAFT_1885693 [Mycena galericulata]|nr:hypothetical protein B0H11DRAFT_1885693 [Mycena galericulata]